MILDGSKSQTIRADRKGRRGHAKPEDRIYLYFGMRTKWCKKLGEAICEQVQDIKITEDGKISVDGYEVYAVHLDWFAWKDGFRPDGSTEDNPQGALELMMRFWRQTHSLPFEGKLIQWTDFKPTP